MPCENSKVRHSVELCLRSKKSLQPKLKMKTKMKKLLFAIALSCCYFAGTAQTKVTADEAKSITANVMANFTDATSFAYTKGISLDQFKVKLCNKAIPVSAGNGMIETAYSYLSKGISKSQIVKENDGIAVANAFKFLSDQHNKGIEPDGTELFGGKSALENAPVAKAAECKWYQFWCLVQNFANWVVLNWPTIYQILVAFGLV